MTRSFTIGTRGSKLALWQAGQVKAKLEAIGIASTIRVISTTGDRRQDVPLAQIGGKGLFIKEIEESLVRGEIDLAVHSLKDVPSRIPEHFTLAGFLERGDPRDAWIHPANRPIRELAAGSIIGTSSPRRRVQLKQLFPHLDPRDIRGNVETRIAKTRDGQYDGVVLAAAGIDRLGRAGDITSYFSLDEIVPAAGQGIVTIETMSERTDARDAAVAITDHVSAVAAACERGLLQRFEDRMDCHTSIAAHAVLAGETVTLSVFLSDPAGTRSIRTSAGGGVSEMDDLLNAVAGRLRDQGALELITEGATS